MTRDVLLAKYSIWSSGLEEFPGRAQINKQLALVQGPPSRFSISVLRAVRSSPRKARHGSTPTVLRTNMKSPLLSSQQAEIWLGSAIGMFTAGHPSPPNTS